MGIVTFSEVLDAVGNFKRPLVEGEAILDSGLLITVERLSGNLADLDDRIVKVSALCLQTSALFSNPHVIKLDVNTIATTNRLQNMSCSCKAGTSEKCKHVIAVLMYLHKTKEVSELEELSSTDITQQWGKLKSGMKEDYEATPVKEYCHVSKPASVYSRGISVVSDDIAAKFADLLINGDPKSEIYHHSKLLREEASVKNCTNVNEKTEMRQMAEEACLITNKILQNEPSLILQDLKNKTDVKANSLSSDLEFYEERVKVTKEKCVSIASGTVSQSENLWFKERSIRITGSKCYTLYTYSSNKKPDWGKKLCGGF